MALCAVGEDWVKGIYGPISFGALVTLSGWKRSLPCLGAGRIIFGRAVDNKVICCIY